MEKRFKAPDGEVFTLYELRKLAEPNELEDLEAVEVGKTVFVSYFCSELECIL
jgi:hypothetical protein